MNSEASQRKSAAGYLRAARRAPSADAAEAAAWVRCLVPESRAAMRLEIRCALAIRDTDMADALIERGLLSQPDDPQFMVWKAERLLEQRRLPEAQLLIDRAIEYAPARLHARLVAGRIALAQQKLRTAIEHFEMLLAMRPTGNPWERETRSRLIDALIADGDLERAWWVLEAFHPQPPRLVARVLRAEGRLLDAADVLEATLSQSHDQHDADAREDQSELDCTRADLIDIVEGSGNLDWLTQLLEDTTVQTPLALIRAAEAWMSMGHLATAIGVVQPLLNDPVHRRAALTIMTIASACDGSDAEAEDALVAIGQTTSGRVDTQLSAHAWQRAYFGRSIRAAALPSARQSPAPDSPLLRLVASAAEVFAQAGPRDAAAAAHLRLCRAVLDDEP
ncbi:MAG: tetratricopeptide repeat protein [Phycisphaerales bacterium]